MSKRVVLNKKVEISQAGIRLDKYLSTTYPDFSRNHIQIWIEAGMVTVNGAKTKSKLILKGDEKNVVESYGGIKIENLSQI